MFNIIKAALEYEGITRVGAIPLSECDIINARILPSEGKSAIIFVIPYRSTTEPNTDGFSEYARTYDYHKYAYELYERIVPLIQAKTNASFKCFCDHSPINEKLAASKCGLGIIGKNSLFYDEVYGSFVFLGSIITDLEINTGIYEIRHCHNCGACLLHCPGNAILNLGIDKSKCLSAISQKKHKTFAEVQSLKEHNIIWGCDKCQNVCPQNKDAKISPIPYFKNNRINKIDKDYIIGLSDEDFSKYAFAYKGRQIVLNNIDFIP